MRRVTSFPLPTSTGWRLRVTRALTSLIPAVKAPGVTVEIRHAEKTRVRVYRPANRRSTAALLWIHGGGLIIGSAVQDDRFCAQVARDLGIVIVSTEYRLAPEHPYPAALDDCLAAWTWLQGEAELLSVDSRHIALGGESAGGGLAASLAQRLHDTASDVGVAAPAAQWLFCPMLDDRTAASKDLDALDHFVWNNRLNRFGWRSYLGVAPGSDNAPVYASPARRVDLHELPATWIGYGDIELFSNEDHDYAERLRDAGVDVTTDVVAGAPHGFESWASNTDLARAYVARARSWLQQTLQIGAAVARE
jgi:acetyl esterase/lipase